MGYEYEYPRPMVTVDIVVFRLTEKLEAVAIRRKKDPFGGELALPGGFVEMDEDLPVAAARELAEETSLRDIDLHQLAAFGTPGRDPRGRNIAIAFVGVLDEPNRPILGGDDASAAMWVDARTPPSLAFDHSDILEKAVTWFDRRSSG